MKTLRFLCASVALYVFLGLGSSIAYSQAVNATLLGTVTDSSGGVLPNAKVTAVETNTGNSRSTQANDSGNYTFPNMPPGVYSLTVEVTGFKKETRKEVSLLVNSSTRVDLQLTPGSVSESIEVSAAAEALQTDRADTGAKIEEIQTASLPLGTQRNYQALLNLVPGTTRASFQHSQFFNAASSLQTEVNGQMRQGNSYSIEGVDNNQKTGLLQVLTPPIEAIESVDVSTSNFEAELGKASGANTNVMLKSGTNRFHGAGYEFMRNSELNARNFFDASVGHLVYNYFGGNIGGPIRKNKTFFFTDFLRITDHEANTNLGTIPPSSWRGGDLSSGLTLSPQVVVYDPATGNADGTNRTPFAGNIIPSNRISPISARILKLVPGQNQAGSESAPNNNYFALLPFTKDTNSFDVKMDHNISEKDRLTGRFSYARPVTSQAPIFGIAGGWAQGGFQGTSIQKTYSAGLNYNRIFSPTLLAQFRVGMSHYHNDALNTDSGTTASKDIGIPGANIDSWTSGLTSIGIGGFSGPLVGYSASLPWRRAEVNINAVNTWTKTWRNHTFKFGADYRRLRDELLQTQTINPRGAFNFGTAQTSLNPGAGGIQPKTGPANNFASFLLDLPSDGGRDIAAYFPALRAHQFFAFAQDKWQVSSKLTMDLGLRWEFYPPATPRFAGGFSNYNPTNNTLELAGIGNVPMNLGLKTNYKYFAPRLGAAYRVNNKMVVRAGFGISYTGFPDNTYAYNFPVKQNNQFVTGASNFAPAVTGNGSFFSMATGFPPPQLAVIPSNGIITNPSLSQSNIVIPKNYSNPYVESWNLSVQHNLPKNFTIDVAYVGNHGVRNSAAYNLNVPNSPELMGKGTAGRPLFIQYGRTADTTVQFAGYSSMYNALQAKINRRFHNGLMITTAYTFSKGMAFQTGDDGGLWNYISPRRSYARTDFDRHQTFVQSYVYDLPFGPGKRWLSHGLTSQVLGGWQVNGIFTLMTGTPLTFGANGSSLNTPGSPQTADQVADVTKLYGINTPARGGSAWFSQASFVQPTGVRFGTSGRNILSGPNFFNLDASIFKIFQIAERFKMEIRGESFSITNTAQFGNPNTDVSSSNYGYVTGAGGGRGLQLGAKLSF